MANDGEEEDECGAIKKCLLRIDQSINQLSFICTELDQIQKLLYFIFFFTT